MNIREYIKQNILVLDGAMGTMLQNNGLAPGQSPEVFNITNPQVVTSIHQQYVQAGSKMIMTNTFGANSKKLASTGYNCEAVISAAVQNAKAAAQDNAYVGLDIGPIGELLEPMGMLSFDQAYDLFKQQILIGVKAGVDAIYIETMTDLAEAKCAILAAKENCDLPIFCTMSFEGNMRTFLGVSISSMALTLSGLGADFIGINCSVGPAEMKAMVEQLLPRTDLPIIIKPNAGLPDIVNGETVFNVSEQTFATELAQIVDMGVGIVGGCCGTAPKFIECLSQAVATKKVVKRQPVTVSSVCSAAQVVDIDRVRIIGERINPTGKKSMAKALLEDDMDYLVEQALQQIEAGAEILDVNVGLAQINESVTMVSAITSIQSAVRVPLQIDSSRAEVLEAGLRAYTGKAIVNSVNGDFDNLNTILPIVKKYGAAVIGLTLDKNGIPKTAQKRLEIAERIVNTAVSYGIPKHDVFIDCLTLTAGAEQAIVYTTLDSLELVKKQLGVKTVLGVSNISFGLPARDKMNQVFLSMALAKGLDLPIINPNASEMMDTVYCYHQLTNVDKDGILYIKRFGEQKLEATDADTLEHYLLNGLKDEIKPIVTDMLSGCDGLEIVDKHIIPALDKVGERYETGKIFLPQLMRCAEAAKAAFEVIKESMPADSESRGKIVLATVKGDIHDIGKNIVKVVLENYGYEVIDLGRDVAAEEIAQQAQQNNVNLVGLSALMTTTIESMEQTISILKTIGVKTMVGGAVMTAEGAKRIGADFYAKDPMDAIEIARECMVSAEGKA